MGIADRWILDAYIEGIEAASELLGGQLQWSPPARHPDIDRVPVPVFDLENFLKELSPFTFFYDREGYRSFIALQSELWETTRRAARERARIIGAHETTHAFTHVHKGLLSDDYEHWGWFDEATAVYVEWFLNPRSTERHRFARHWIHSPERGLEHEGRSIGYETAWFVEYLVRKYTWQILYDVWHHHKPGETPIQAIDRWFRERNMIFRDVSHEVEDVFGRGYCIESFLTTTVCPRLHRRFGNRWNCCSFNPSLGDVDSHEGTIEPMACRYYKIAPKKPRNGFRVEVHSASPLQQCGLKANVFAVQKQVMLESPQALTTKGVSLSTTILGNTIVPVSGAEYYILAIANVLSRIDEVGNPSPRRLGYLGAKPNTSAFRVEVSA